ncbi:peptide-methionine (S)-S-oxide reductase MsrA [Paenibacillus sp. XY044]|uniref:peptide-methionine (S)-S-oxide reductase MsrA n=1 Tax=Paenibacillus sp. XY044 TaxID=2026089 RepID=UPI000B99297C|nr:peptide-methionine (S)-S-oxide reductase MsrA [Paenibacillus sp. XY044]OZB92798.1 peptide-methionine (S)-S-oxide reductase [Paenibacillus sp. XY044]
MSVQESGSTHSQEPGDVPEIVTLGMGCFWSPEALFGHMPGVIRTRVGYGGGRTADPTYRDMGDHTETVEVVYDPGVISLTDVLNVFWDHHNPSNINDYKGRQYLSLLLYRDHGQLETIHQVLDRREEQGEGKPDTEIAPLTTWYPAEDRHQKYYLKRHPDAMEQLSRLYPAHEELANSTLAARLNGLAKGYTSLERIRNEIQIWPLAEEERSRLLETAKRIKW